MEQNLQSANIEKHRKTIQETEKFLRENTQTEISTEQIQKMTELGCLPEELGNWFSKHIKDLEREFQEIQEFIKNNQHIPEDERLKHFYKERQLSAEEVEKRFEDAANIGLMYKAFCDNRELLKQGGLDDLPNIFFKSLEKGEFGISRLITDPLNRVPQLLKKEANPELINEDIYLIKWDHETKAETTRLEYRFRALNANHADKLAQDFVTRITGRQKKVFQACWAMANKKARRTYTCLLTELMSTAYPNRKDSSPFSVKERVEFYQDLQDLTQTQFIVSKKPSEGKKRKSKIESFLLPFITIHKFTEDNIEDKQSERYPNQITLSVMHNPLYENEKMYQVGAAIKYSTLELKVDDTQLAEWIQIRKHQLKNNDYITLDRDFIIRIANLQNIKNKWKANQLLKEKLERLKEKGVVKEYPKTITDPINIKIR